jgi:hypothetical protein
MTAKTGKFGVFPLPAKKKRRKIGPFARRLSFGQLDLRTAEGQFANDVRLALTEQLGGNPTPAQQLLIQSVSLKALRCELLTRRVLCEQNIKSNNDNHLLAWMNAMRRDLQALGLDTAPATPEVTFAEHFASLGPSEAAA